MGIRPVKWVYRHLKVGPDPEVGSRPAHRSLFWALGGRGKMKAKIMITRYREEAFAVFAGTLLTFALYAFQLWLTLPFNCSGEECLVPLQRLNQQRLGIWLFFAPLTAITLSPAMVFIVRHIRGKTLIFSKLGVVALGCSVLSFLTLTSFFFWGIIIIPFGIGISLLAVIVSITRKLKSKTSSFHWGDFLALVISTAWCFLGYFYIIRFWEVFGD